MRKFSPSHQALAREISQDVFGPDADFVGQRAERFPGMGRFHLARPMKTTFQQASSMAKTLTGMFAQTSSIQANCSTVTPTWLSFRTRPTSISVRVYAMTPPALNCLSPIYSKKTHRDRRTISRIHLWMFASEVDCSIFLERVSMSVCATSVKSAFASRKPFRIADA